MPYYEIWAYNIVNRAKEKPFMYNTLKEIQDALSEEELYMYADKAEGKTAEEVVEILKRDNIEISIEAAKECVDYLKDIEIVSDEELENVTGGTCFSSGVTDPKTGENRKYAIVSPLNKCPLTKFCELPFSSTCNGCDSHFIDGSTWYCRDRWEGHNTPYEDEYHILHFIDD